MPNEVTELALKLSGVGYRMATTAFQLTSLSLTPGCFECGTCGSMARGPLIPSVPVFRQAFMDRFAAEPFLKALPEVAAEVMFGVLLDIPRRAIPR